jgi:hypothetical protein
MAWVTFETSEGATAALAHQGKDFNGSQVRVELSTRGTAEDKPKRERAPREPRAAKAAAADGASPAGGSGASSSEARPATYYTDRVSIRGLPRDATAEDVKAFFAPSAVKSIRFTRQMTIVTFETAEGASAAVAAGNTKGFPTKALPASESREARPAGERSIRVAMAIKTKARAAAPAASAAAAPAKAAAGAPAERAKGGRRGAKAADGAAPAAAAAGAGGPRKSPRVEVTFEAAGAATEEQVRAFLASAGSVTRVVPRADGASFGVTFETSDGADAAIAKSGAKIGSGVATIAPASSSPRKRGSGQGAAGGDSAAPKEAGAGRRRKAEPAAAEEVANMAWVSGLAEGADESSVRGLFAGVGGAISAVSVRSRSSKDKEKPILFAYVTFDSAAAFERALALPLGNGVKVEKASRPPRPAKAE